MFDPAYVDLDILALHIRGQNAGIIIRRSSIHYSFESFEVSPTPGAVIGAKGRLRWCFPGPAVAVDQDRIANPNFLKPLTEYFVKTDAETPEEALPIVTKAHSKVIEIRDTAHPRFVTEMLTGILRAIGQPLNVPRIYKHLRDDVLCKKALKPWRRSPLWLFLRVAFQTSLMRNDMEEPHMRYKSFMLFFMAYLLDGALKASLPSDTLFIMTAKISRRALKIGAMDPSACLQYVTTTMGAAQQELSRRWALLEKHPDPFATQQNWAPSQLSFLSDTHLVISNLKPYMTIALARLALPSTNHGFTSHCCRRISQCSSSLPEMNLFTERDSNQVSLNLVDLEFWIEHSLNDWVQANKESQNACTALAALIDTYAAAGSVAYQSMPEETSLMLLTLMELWVALDKCALQECKLLHDYTPEFPESLFEPLLLPKKPQMERLHRVEH